MTETVWIVTTGTYSDYQIRRVFSSEEKAKEYAYTLQRKHRYHHEDPDIEEWEVDATFDPSTDVYWKVVMDDKETWAAKRKETPPGPEDYPWDTDLNVFVLRGNQWSGWVRAPSEEHAIKIAAEEIAEAKYKEAWVEGVVKLTGGTIR